MMQTLQLAFRNLTRNRRRTMLAALAVFFGVSALLVIRGVLNGVQAAQRSAMVERYTGAIQVHRTGYFKQIIGNPLALAFPVESATMDKLRAIPGVRGVSERILFGVMLNANDTSVLAMATAFAPAHEYGVCPRRQEDVATGLPVSDEQPGGIVPAASMIRRLKWDGTTPGALLGNDQDGVLNALDISLRGTSGLPNVPGVEARTMMMHLKTAQELLRMEGKVTEIAIALRDMQEIDRVVTLVRSTMGPGYEVHTWQDLAPFIVGEEKNQEIIFAVFVAIFILAALLGITNTMLVNMLERVREIGTMLAVGARRRRVLTLFLMEGVLLALVGCAVGTAFACALVAVLGEVGIHLKFVGGGILHIYPYTKAWQAAGLTTFCAVGAMVASLSPAWRASRLTPSQALLGAEG